jgi:glycosyltransferase involved in cell wall biosynthesis
MKLLILTQKVDKNDAILGFFHNWLLEFSRHCEKLTVICLAKGEYNLPRHVKVLSLGKESGASSLKYLFNFYKYLWQLRHDYDRVLVHMNVEYIILGAFSWRVLRKKIALWYMHKQVDWKLRWAEKLTDYIFTGSAESFRLPSQKLKVLHHGIDSQLFYFKDKVEHKEVRLLTTGRITPIKQINIMIDLLTILESKINRNIVLEIVGTSITGKDKQYQEGLRRRAGELNLSPQVKFLGAVTNKEIVKLYQEADIFLNFSQTGSLDKAILEAMSCGTLVVSSNEASQSFLPAELFVNNSQPEMIADKIVNILNLSKEKNLALRKELRQYVENNHDLGDLISKIVSNF